MANSTTVYAVNSEQDKSAVLRVFEGAVEVTKNQPLASSSPEGNSSTAPATPAGNNIDWVVNALSRMTISKDGLTVLVQPMPKEEVCEALAFANSVEIALHRTPAEVGGNVAKFVNFESISDREIAFRAARCNSFWNPNQPSTFEELGKVYNDWGDADQAAALFEKATNLYKKDATWKPSEELSINKAIAFRKLSRFAEALDEVKPVIAVTQSKYIGDALNIRGSVFHDQARNKLTFSPADLSEVKKLLTDADSDYQEALRKGATQRQYIEVNRGLVQKTQGDLARREKRYQYAVESYVKAITLLKDVYGYDDKPKPELKIVSLSVAQARAALANVYSALGKTQESEKAFGDAEKTYVQLIVDAENDGQKFPLAHCGLASLYLISGRPEARENYDKCMALNGAESVTEVISVPDVVGLRRADAIHVLAEAGLEPEITTEGQVVKAQQPVGTAKPGDKIKIELGSMN